MDGSRRAVPVPVPFLDDAGVRAAGARAGLGERFLGRLRAAAAQVRARPALLRLASGAHHVLFETDRPPDPALARLDEAAGELAELLHALLVLDTIRLVTRRQRERGIPEAVTDGVVRRHPVTWLHQVEAAEGGSDQPAGRPGRPWQPPTPFLPAPEWDPHWFRLVAGGTLYRVGRLELTPIPWLHPFHAFRHRARGDLVLVAGGGLPLTADGYLTGDTCWRSELDEVAGSVVGHPVWPTGRVDRGTVRLDRTAWDELISPGTPVLDLHVPEDAGPLDLPSLRDALDRAGPFFEHFHPGLDPVAFVCTSWLFGPQWPGILGEDSGIVRWQREGYLFPDDASTGSVLRWVFGTRAIDPATAPADTRLRSGVLDLLRRGEPLRAGRWLLARADLPRFGAQPYRRSGPAVRALLDVQTGDR